MGQKRFNLKPNTLFEKCPNCGNNTEFVAISEQICEDGCEIWVKCKCGFDPTENKIGHKLEDVWGTIDKDTIAMALDIWDDEITAIKELSV